MNHERVKDLVTQLLIEIGEDPNREGLRDTPRRVAEVFECLTSGYKSNPDDIVKNAAFTAEANNMIILRDIEVYSLCEHHMLPFFGKCHVGYIPSKTILGISKVARVVDCYARRLQMQERLTAQIADAIRSSVDAEGVGVVMEDRKSVV